MHVLGKTVFRGEKLLQENIMTGARVNMVQMQNTLVKIKMGVLGALAKECADGEKKQLFSQ